MGHTLSATIYYGFPLNEDDLEDEELLDTWEDKVRCAAGVPSRPDLGEELYHKAHQARASLTADEEKLFKQWEEYCDASGNAIKEIGCDIDFSGELDWDEHGWYVCVTSRKYEAFDGDNKEVSSCFPDDGDDVPCNKLKKFCEIVGITWREPGWYLTASRS